MEDVLGILMLIVAIIGAFVTVVYLRKYKNAERMAMIEKGLDVGSLKQDISGPLRFSLTLIGAGVGLLMGFLLDEIFGMKEVAYFSMILILGGLGLGGAYLIEERKARKS